MFPVLLVLVSLAAPISAGEVLVTSDELGVTLRCPRAACEPDAVFADFPDGYALVGLKEFSSHKVIEAAPEASLDATYASEAGYLGRFFALQYERLKPGAFAVLSGLGRGKDSDKVVYEKLIMGKQGVVGLRLVYPVAKKAELDPIVSELMNSFKSIRR